MQVPGAAGAQQVDRVDGRHFLKPDSALVRAALDLLTTHVADAAAGISPRCAQCGRYFPCPTVDNARQVVVAGGGLLTVAGQLEQKAGGTPAKATGGVPAKGTVGAPAKATVGVRAQPGPVAPAGGAAAGPTEQEAGGEPEAQQVAGDPAGLPPVSGGPVEVAAEEPAGAVSADPITRVPRIVAQRVRETTERRIPDTGAQADTERVTHDPVGAA